VVKGRAVGGTSERLVTRLVVQDELTAGVGSGRFTSAQDCGLMGEWPEMPGLDGQCCVLGMDPTIQEQRIVRVKGDPPPLFEVIVHN